MKRGDFFKYSSLALVFSGAWLGSGPAGHAENIAAWGMDYYGSVTVPSGLGSIVAICGGAFHALGLRTDSTVASWGYDPYYCCVPDGLSNVVAIASGLDHDLALRSDGTVVEWGAMSAVPAGLSNVISIAGGRSHSLVAKSDGTCVTWGWMSGPAYVPPGLSNVVAVAAGFDNSVALKSDGTVVGWGNSGAATPRLAVNDVATISAGYSGGVALRSNGTVVTWGSLPAPPPGLTNVARIAAKWFWGLAWQTDGTLVAWGDNYGGQLDVPNRLTNVIAIAAEEYTGLVLVGDGPPQSLWTLSNVVGLAEGTVSFNGAAVGTEPLSYQWRRAGTNLLGAAMPVLTLTNIQPEQAGLYSVIVSNAYGAVTNSGAVLTLTPALITAQPTHQTIYGGDTATNSVGAQGPGLQYQWRFLGTNLPGQTNAQVAIANVTTNNAGEYTVMVSNTYGSVASSNATLTVVPIAITAQPAGQSLYVNDRATFSVVAARNGPFTYQWRFNGDDLPGATDSILTIVGLRTTNSGSYSVVVANPYGVIESSNAVLNVLDTAPIISSQPASRGVYPGGSASFLVAADGSKPLNYQWLLNGANIPDATNAALLLTNLTTANVGIYSVRVSNPVGSTLSSNATLTFLSVVTWGQTNYAELGNIPVGLTNVIAVAAGSGHSVALKSDGKVVVWGDNYWGQTNVPANLSNVVAIAAAWNHTLALKSNGTVVSWGDLTTVPAALTNAVAIAAGDAHSLALKADGTVVAWGTGTATNVPANLSNVVAIAAGGYFSVALKRNGTLTTWGAAIPTSGMTNVTAISANEFPLVAIKADGTLVASGVTPPPPGLSNVVSVAAGRYHALALKSDGTVTNWTGIGPATPAGLTNVAVIASGQNHCLAIIGNGPPRRQALPADLERNTGSFSLSLPTHCGRVYALEYLNSLSETNWTPLPLAAGNGGVITLTDMTATSPQRFYRVRQW